MAYIKKKSERKFKITVCNGYKVNGQKRMKAQTITVPSSVPKRGIQQYVMAEAERIEKKFKYGVEESDQTHFDQYAENWLKRQEPFFKATTYAGYKRNLDIVYPLIGGIPLAKLLPMTLEELPPAGRGEASGGKPDARSAEQPKSVLCCIYEKQE